MINGIIKSIFDGYKESEETKRRQYENRFNELDETEFLFSSDYMNQLYFSAKTPDDCWTIMNYLAVGLGGVLFALGWAVFKNPLIRSLVIGF